MAERKSTRVKSGLGGRPKGEGVRHTTSHRQQEPDIEELSPDDAIHRDEEIEDDNWAKSASDLIVKALFSFIMTTLFGDTMNGYSSNL